jgi:hypothetical protein
VIPKGCKRLAEVDFPIAEVSRHATLLNRRGRRWAEFERHQGRRQLQQLTRVNPA